LPSLSPLQCTPESASPFLSPDFLKTGCANFSLLTRQVLRHGLPSGGCRKQHLPPPPACPHWIPENALLPNRCPPTNSGKKLFLAVVCMERSFFPFPVSDRDIRSPLSPTGSSLFLLRRFQTTSDSFPFSSLRRTGVFFLFSVLRAG